MFCNGQGSPIHHNSNPSPVYADHVDHLEIDRGCLGR